jgi:nucleotide-binding universal stress UspA family protein
MISLNKILLPVDFSEQCQAAAPYVADLANRFRARLDLLHVIEGGSHIAELRRRSAAALAAFAGHIPHGMYCPQTIALGDPAQAIARYAKTHDIDFIVIPHRREGGLLASSITGKVLCDAACAVWTGSFKGRARVGSGPVLCAVDMKSENKTVLSYASALARNLGSKLMVVNAMPARAAARAAGVGAGSGRSPSSSDLLRMEAQHKLDELLQSTSISAEASIETGPPGEAIGRAAERTGAALLVIGRRSRAGEPDGMDVGELIRRSPCPVVFSPRRHSTAACFWTEWQQEEHARETDSSLDLVPHLSL